jgi:hypothetical protein
MWRSAARLPAIDGDLTRGPPHSVDVIARVDRHRARRRIGFCGRCGDLASAARIADRIAARIPGSLTGRREQIVVMAAIAALWGLFFVQAWQTPRQLDDWLQLGWYRGRGFDLALIAEVARSNYVHDNPRTGDVLLLLVNGPRAIHLVVTPLCELVLLWAVFVVSFGRRPQLANRDLARALVLQVLIWLASPLPGVLYFYRPFTANYLLAFVPTMCLLVPYRLALVEPGPGARWWTPVMLVLGWLAGLGNEHTGGAAIVAVVACTIAVRRRGSRLHAWMIAGAIGLVVGYAMVLLAPGQAERYAGRAARYSALGLITSRGITGAYDIVVGFLGEVQWAVVLVLAAALAFVASHRRRGEPVPAMSRAQLGTIAALLGGAAVMLATLLGSPVAIERLLFAPAVLVAGALAVVVEHAFSVRRLRVVITAVAAVIFAYHAVRFVEISAAAHAENQARIAALAAAKPGSVAALPPYRTARSRWFFGDDFRNAGVREFAARELYGLRGAELEPRPIWAEPTPPETFFARRFYDPPLPQAEAAPPAPSFLDAALLELRQGLVNGGWGDVDGHRLVRYQIDASNSPLVDPRRRPVRMLDWTPDGPRFVYAEGLEDVDRRPSIHIWIPRAPAGWVDAFLVGCGRTTRIEPERSRDDLLVPVELDCRGSYTAYLCDPDVCWFSGRFWR